MGGSLAGKALFSRYVGVKRRRRKLREELRNEDANRLYKYSTHGGRVSESCPKSFHNHQTRVHSLRKPPHLVTNFPPYHLHMLSHLRTRSRTFLPISAYFPLYPPLSLAFQPSIQPFRDADSPLRWPKLHSYAS